ncbi:hypothetical protein B0H65DRAFT_470540 [Neurospora tetraspora]|uniref:C2H2-type domain-containing protein n=1 Tax=Neurospora tetraspora TaxID=94610 RepID=A0AAE0MQW6_9PEZI|nr:hypothetical protein B0H65DRAFT_470540 [Neurospora tetraspora]
MGEGEEGGGGFSIANGNVGFQPQEDIPLSNTYQQPVPLPGLLAPDGYASTARVFQHHGQFPLDTSGLFTEEPPTTQTLPGGLPPEEIFDHNVLTDEKYADLALLEAILDLPNYAYTYLSLPTLPFDPAGTLQSASYPPFVASQNTLFGSTPSSTAVTSYPTSAGTPDIASPSSSWASTASLPTSSTTSPTSFEISPTGSARSKAGRYKCDQLGCKSKHTWATFGDLKRHQRYHDKKPHQCTTSGCTWAFTNKSDVVRHMKTHSEDVTMFPCQSLRGVEKSTIVWTTCRNI